MILAQRFIRILLLIFLCFVISNGILSEDIWDRKVRHTNNGETNHADCGFKCDNGMCISARFRCDNYIDCADSSDENNCTCSDKLGSKVLCDGVDDCPNGEDELNCHGCTREEFSCTDVYSDAKLGCIDISKRCDGTADCNNQKDERDCFRLHGYTDNTRGILSEGLLQKNIGGKWYTVCQSSSSLEEQYLSKYAVRVCESAVGEVDISPKTSSVSVHSYSNLTILQAADISSEPTYPFAKMGDTEAKFSLVVSCQYVYSVNCPEPKCGWPVSRYNTHVSYHRENHYKKYRGKRGLNDDDQYSVPSLMAKVVGGYDGYPGDYPFVVGIYRDGNFHCGGSIVSSQWILTAAHCCHNPEKHSYEIQAGMIRRESYSPHEQTRQVVEIYVHERYDKTIFSNDIALMRMDSPLYLSKWVTTACLSHDIKLDPLPDQLCTVMGWGDLQEDGHSPNHVQQVELPVLTSCHESFTNEAHQICAGVMEGGKDACQGDSGGPFICREEDGRNILSGLVSFGRGCARPNQPGVYTRVSAYYQWIESVVSSPNTHAKAQKRPRVCGQTSKCYRSGGECVNSKLMCDRVMDCFEGEDEAKCNYDGEKFGEESEEPDETVYQNLREASHGKDEHLHSYGSSKLCGPTEFQCIKTKTCVPLVTRCDGKYDCTDSTDEKNCDCGQVLNNTYPLNICDGVWDCMDGTDELECDTCPKFKIKCPYSNQCISESQWCDGYNHCNRGEDELDCMRLVRSKAKLPKDTFLSDKPSRGSSSGYLILRQMTVEWSLGCVEDLGEYPDELVCTYLGLGPSKNAFWSRNSRQTPRYIHKSLPLARSYNTDAEDETTTRACTPVKVTCGEASCGERRLFTYSMQRPNVWEQGAQPWAALIFSEGTPKCLATVVTKEWVITSSNCLRENIRNINYEYMTAVTGVSQMTYTIASPKEQVKRVNYNVELGEVTLLKLESPLVPDHFATPICTNVSASVELNSYFSCIQVVWVNETYLNEWSASVDYTHSIDGEQIALAYNQESCNATGPSFVYCTSDGTSWFLLGFTELPSNDCEPNAQQPILLVNPFYGKDAEYTQNVLKSPPKELRKPPACDGTRCSYGNCVGKVHVCDGIAHCTDYLDERRCQRHFQMLRTAGYDEDMSHSCPTGHFGCNSTGNCVPMSAYCDGEYDCGEDDSTDEPSDESTCSCRHYLTLANPEKVCDPSGVAHCPDRSDQHNCPCTDLSFNCVKGQRECIHPYLVCDGNIDCSHGEDEDDCVTLSKSLTQRVVTINESTVSAPVEGYVLVRVKGQWYPYCSHEWSYFLATTICMDHLHFKEVFDLQTFDLEDAQQLVVEHGYASEDELQLLLLTASEQGSVLRRSDAEDSYGSFEGEYETCRIAWLSCSL